MSDSTVAVAFCYRGFPPNDVALTWRPSVAPLNSNLLLSSEVERWPLAWPSPEISLAESLALQALLDDEWTQLLNGEGPPNLEYYVHEYMDIAAPLAVLRWSIRRILEQFNPSAVLLPNSLRQPATRAGRSGVLEEGLMRILAQETSGCQAILSFDETHSDPLAAGHVTQVRSARAGDVVGSISRTLASGDVVARALRKSLARMQRTSSIHTRPGGLIIGQYAKTWALRRDPFIRRRTTHWDYGHLERNFGFRRDDALTAESGVGGADVATLLAEHIKSYAAVNAPAHERVQVFARESGPRLLITDAHHHPLVRQMVAEWSDGGRPVALIPEGVIHPDATTWPLTRQFFITNTEAVRFVLCAQDKQFWETRGELPERLVMAGYMGDTHMHSRLGEALARLLVERSRSSLGFPVRGTVLVSLDVFADPGDLGVRWVGAPTAIATNIAYGRLVEALIKDGWFVIAKSRDPQVAALMRERYSGMPVMLTSSVPWQPLARAADAVMTLTSSIGKEAVELGRPVVVWSAFTMPTALQRNLQGIPRGAVTIVESISDAMSALARLTGDAEFAESPHFSAEERVTLFGSPEEGLRWVRAHLGH